MLVARCIDILLYNREKGDHGKAISYMGAFSTSCLPNQIVKWVANQSGIEKSKRPDVNTPQLVLGRYLLGSLYCISLALSPKRL